MTLRLTRAELKEWAGRLDTAREILAEALVVATELGERITAEDLEEATRYASFARNCFSWRALATDDDGLGDDDD